jgi:hypothetical protein
MMSENIQSDAGVMQSFQAHVLHGSSDIAAAIVDGPRANVETRLAIYANAYRSRLQEVLEADYPALQVLAGDDLFMQLASGYIAAHPSTSPNARWFGAKLPTFLGSVEPFTSHSVLAEMAEFEWAMSLAFDAPDDPVVQIEVLVTLPAESWPELGFCLHSSVQRITMRWNVSAFWQAVQGERDAPNLLQADLTTPWIVWRRGHAVYFRSLAADEAWALNAVATGANFAALCEGLCAWHAAETIAGRAVEILRQWIDDQMISGLQEI